MVLIKNKKKEKKRKKQVVLFLQIIMHSFERRKKAQIGGYKLADC